LVLLPNVSHMSPNFVFVKDVQVLQVAARELLVRNDLDLSIALLGDGNGVAEVTSAALNLDAVMKELLESLDVEDLVVDGLRAVDDELSQTVSYPSSHNRDSDFHTFLVTFCPFLAPAADFFYMFRYLSLLFYA
jgi:hypothetical protein